MEQYSDSLTCIIFVLEPCDLGIYEVLLPLYFPRNLAEQDNACWQLPIDIGGTDGEPLLPDRQIRIIDNPQHALHGNENISLWIFRLLHIEFKDYFTDKSYRFGRWRDGGTFCAIGDVGEYRRACFCTNAGWFGSSKTLGGETTCRSAGGYHAQADAAKRKVRIYDIVSIFFKDVLCKRHLCYIAETEDLKILGSL